MFQYIGNTKCKSYWNFETSYYYLFVIPSTDQALIVRWINEPLFQKSLEEHWVLIVKNPPMVWKGFEGMQKRAFKTGVLKLFSSK